MFMTGIQAMLEILAQAEVRYIFGNPGSTELPLNDALVGDDRFQYILGLQEVPVAAMADGYAMASGRLGVVNLHISCGLGNAMGMIYNAFREGTPLLITAGQQDRRLAFEEPILVGEMVRVVRPWTKYAVEVQRVEDLPVALRRAAIAALTPPTGPVFLSLPVDLQSEPSDMLDTSPIRVPDTRVRPPLEALSRAAEMLLQAKQPAILAGSRVTERDAVAELVAVAERLGAVVYSEAIPTHGRIPFPSDHPLNGQSLPMLSPQVRDLLAPCDVILVVGQDCMRQYIYQQPCRPIPEKVRLIHIDEDARQLGKNYTLEVGVLGDTKTTLAELAELLDRRADEACRAAVRERTKTHAARLLRCREELIAKTESERAIRPMTARTLMAALADILPDDVAVIEESVTTTNTMFEQLGAIKNTSGSFAHRGWALGWGLGCSLGVKLAWPDRPVLALLGEGAAMYGIQGLWTAARYRIPVTFVICNNGQYQILKFGGKIMQLPMALENRFEGLDIAEPPIDFVALAGSMGVEAHRVEEPDELTERVAASLAGDRPMLFDVPISPGGHQL